MPKILLIDDEREVVSMLTEFLSCRGYSTFPAFDGEEGLRQFDAHAPDIVMCDIKMPRKDGFQFLKELRSSKSWVPVIMLSAVTEPAEIMKGYDFQADYYITKPIDLNEVLKGIQIMLSLAPLRKK